MKPIILQGGMACPLNTNPKPQKHDPYLFVEGMACLMDGACQPLCQVMLLEASCHPYVSGMRTCIMPHAEHVYLICNTYAMCMQNERIRAVCASRSASRMCFSNVAISQACLTLNV